VFGIHLISWSQCPINTKPHLLILRQNAGIHGGSVSNWSVVSPPVKGVVDAEDLVPELRIPEPEGIETLLGFERPENAHGTLLTRCTSNWGSSLTKSSGSITTSLSTLLCLQS